MDGRLLKHIFQLAVCAHFVVIAINLFEENERERERERGRGRGRKIEREIQRGRDS